MARKMILVSDDRDFIDATKAFAQSRGCEFHVFSTSEWNQNIVNPHWVQSLGDSTLITGSKPLSEGAKILPFPGTPGASGGVSVVGNKKVQTINELESEAIENAIYNFNGNLTEAAKALGIGRATLYRKVKQYNIDPSSARKRKIAA